MSIVTRTLRRRRIHKRIRKKISGSISCPRLSVFFSNSHVYAQVINDQQGVTICSASTLEKKEEGRSNVANAIYVGSVIAERALAAGIKSVVFDRGGFVYHGKVKALADAARGKGLKF